MELNAHRWAAELLVRVDEVLVRLDAVRATGADAGHHAGERQAAGLQPLHLILEPVSLLDVAGQRVGALLGSRAALRLAVAGVAILRRILGRVLGRVLRGILRRVLGLRGGGFLRGRRLWLGLWLRCRLCRRLGGSLRILGRRLVIVESST